jgi:hypothetical protein
LSKRKKLQQIGDSGGIRGRLSLRGGFTVFNHSFSGFFRRFGSPFLERRRLRAVVFISRAFVSSAVGPASSVRSAVVFRGFLFKP